MAKTKARPTRMSNAGFAFGWMIAKLIMVVNSRNHEEAMGHARIGLRKVLEADPADRQRHPQAHHRCADGGGGAMSHFTVLVIGPDHEDQLASYDENLEVDAYRRPLQRTAAAVLHGRLEASGRGA